MLIQPDVSNLHLISDIIAVVIVIVTVSGLAYSIKNTADGTASKLSDALNGIGNLIKDHEARIRDGEGKITILWDGHERRTTAEYFNLHPRDRDRS
jgi:hypothetical protein